MNNFMVLLMFIIIPVGIFLVISFIFDRYRVNLFDENSIQKIVNNNFTLLEIKRYRKIIKRSNHFGGFAGYSGFSTNSTVSSTEPPLEEEIHIPESSSYAKIPKFEFDYDDTIVVYGYKKSRKYTLFGIYWSKENAKDIKRIVNKINEEIKSKVMV